MIQIIYSNNQECSFHIATDEEYKNKLLEKLQEEIQEFLIERNEEELGDIFEVIEHVIIAINFNEREIFRHKEAKAQKNGKLYKKIILEFVYDL